MTLRATNISVRFGGIQALDGVSVEVQPGQVVSVIGPNGSGKSTLFNAITGFVTPDTGRVKLDGRELDQAKPHQRVRLGLVRTFQTPRIDPDITVFEALKCGLSTLPKGGLIRAALATPKNRRDERRIEEEAQRVVEELGLAHVKDMPMGELPMGMVRLVDVGRAAVCQPKFILLDEPAAGWSADEQDVLKAQIRRLATNGVGVLLVEHNFRFVMELAEHLTVLDQGKVIASGDPEQVSKQPEFIRAYLGSIGEV